MDWTEKYRPKSLDDVLGNPGAVNSLRQWAESWNNGIPEKRAVVLIGTPGIGKTTSAEALAIEMGWSLVEMNASDQRTADAIEGVAILGSKFDTFSDDGTYGDSSKGARKLIVLDEADSFFGNADRGAIPVVTKLIKSTLQPVILIVNDYYELSRKCSAAKTDTLQINFQKPKAPTMIKALSAIAQKEGVAVDPEAMSIIAERASGDMRAAVRNLEALSLGQTHVTAEMAEGISARDKHSDLYGLMAAIFRSNNPSRAREMMREVEAEPSEVELWVDENLPYEYIDHGDLIRGYNMITSADIFMGRVMKRQYYGFWSYASDLMTMGVATARFTNKVSHDRIHFPTYLSKMSRSKAVRSMRKSVDLKLAVYLHTSTKRIDLDVIGCVKQMVANDPELRIAITKDLKLEPEELAFLMDKKPDSKDVKAVFAEIEKEIVADVKQDEPVKEEPKKAAEAPKEPAQKNAKSKNQASLFDFRGG